ncbi:MAG: hypothetical protein ABI548_18050 [Polyangiaceae bacterium]
MNRLLEFLLDLGNQADTLQLGAAFFPSTPDGVNLDHAPLLIVEIVDVGARLRHQHALA